MARQYHALNGGGNTQFPQAASAPAVAPFSREGLFVAQHALHQRKEAVVEVTGGDGPEATRTMASFDEDSGTEIEPSALTRGWRPAGFS